MNNMTVHERLITQSVSVFIQRVLSDYNGTVHKTIYQVDTERDTITALIVWNNLDAAYISQRLKNSFSETLSVLLLFSETGGK